MTRGSRSRSRLDWETPLPARRAGFRERRRRKPFPVAISDHAGLTPLWFETLTDGMDGWERQAVLSRVVRALLGDEIANGLRKPPAVEALLSGKKA